VQIECENCVFYVGTIYRIYLYIDDINSDGTVVLGLIRVKISNIFNVLLNLLYGLCCAWIVYPV
jgi:hypothetical protein